MNKYDFIEMLEKAARVKTLYVMGAFGAPAWDKNKERWIKNHTYNQKEERKNKINAASADTFMFDCCGLVKAVINEWNADTTKVYGGTQYAKNIPDTTIYNMLHKYCDNVSSDFTNIVPGAFVVNADYGHCGVYIGDGIVIESTPIWKDGVQKTICKNVLPSATGQCRTWAKWGTFKMIDYTDNKEVEDIVKCPHCGKNIKVELIKDAVEVQEVPAKKTNDEIAREVLKGLWGNGNARKEALTKAGYNYSEIQKIVNELCK